MFALNMMMDTKLCNMGMAGIHPATLGGVNSCASNGVIGGRYTPPYRQAAPTAPPDSAIMRRLSSPPGTDNGSPQSNQYGTINDNLLARAEALAASDINKSTSSTSLMRTDGLFGHADMPPHDPNMPPSRAASVTSTTNGQLNLPGFNHHHTSVGESMLEQLTNVHMPMGGISPEGHNGFGLSVSHHSGIPPTAQMYPMNSYCHHSSSPMTMTMAAAVAANNINNNIMNSGLLSPASSISGAIHSSQQAIAENQHQLQQQQQSNHQPSLHQAQQQHNLNISPPIQQANTNASISPASSNPHSQHPEMDSDPRELEAFAEHFKQRRIKLGVTQADVGNALGTLKIPGVGSLSQSTICRFESLTLSHNNMIALKPVLQTWLEDAELASRQAVTTNDVYANDKKRKRTSIAAPEKRSLEAYFAIQPRPSGEKIAQIAEKLDLKKNVVRVWFCNQRQKQKRMKFSATVQGQNSPVATH